MGVVGGQETTGDGVSRGSVAVNGGRVGWPPREDWPSFVLTTNPRKKISRYSEQLCQECFFFSGTVDDFLVYVSVTFKRRICLL